MSWEDNELYDDCSWYGAYENCNYSEGSWNTFFSDLWRRVKHRLTPVLFCIECGKPDTIFGKCVGDHSDCLPF